MKHLKKFNEDMEITCYNFKTGESKSGDIR